MLHQKFVQEVGNDDTCGYERNDLLHARRIAHFRMYHNGYGHANDHEQE
jgi:hypothetical protein